MSGFSKKIALKIIENQFGVDTKNALSKYWNDEEYDDDGLQFEFKSSDIDDCESCVPDIDNAHDVIIALQNYAQGKKIDKPKRSTNAFKFVVFNKVESGTKLIPFLDKICKLIPEVSKNDRINAGKYLKKIKCYNELWNENDKVLTNWIVLSLSFGEHFESIFGMLVDNFMRYYIDVYINTNKSCEITKWGNTRLKGLSNKNITAVTTGLNAFFARASPRLILPSFKLIKDDLNLYGKMCINIFKFIYQCIKTNCYPIQFDFVIIPKEISDDDDTDIKDDYADTDDDGYDDIDPDDDIKDNKILLESMLRSYSNNEIIKKHINCSKITHNDMVSTFKSLLNKKGISDDNISYKRFIFAFDRQINDEDKSKNNYYTFIPKRNNIIPKDYIPESFLVNSKYIVKSDAHSISVTDSNVFCLSFHIINKDIIKCYQYFAGMMSRFYPNDIHTLWPHIFIKSNNQQQKPNNNISKNIIEINTILKDNHMGMEL